MNNSKFLLFALIFNFCNTASSGQLTYNELEVMYDSAWTFKNLQMIPVKFKPRDEGIINYSREIPRPMSFSEAMLKRKIKVQEMQYENGADVNLLQVTNHSRHEVVVQGGEILEGGKQDRMVGETKYLAPGTTDYIQVYCVEKQRWSPKAKEFNHRGIANREVQKAMNLSKRQSEVWREIDRQFKKRKQTSETWSYLELYNNTQPIDTSYINFFTKKYFESDSNLAGFVFITGDNAMSTEIFSSYSLLDITFANMLNSYVQSVVDNGSRPIASLSKIKKLMNNVLTSEESQRTYVNSHGQMHRNSEGKIIHIIAYPE